MIENIVTEILYKELTRNVILTQFVYKCGHSSPLTFSNVYCLINQYIYLIIIHLLNYILFIYLLELKF